MTVSRHMTGSDLSFSGMASVQSVPNILRGLRVLVSVKLMDQVSDINFLYPAAGYLTSRYIFRTICVRTSFKWQTDPGSIGIPIRRPRCLWAFQAKLKPSRGTAVPEGSERPVLGLAIFLPASPVCYICDDVRPEERLRHPSKWRDSTMRM